MPPAFQVRRLGPADLALMRSLNALFARAFDDPASYAAAPPQDDYLAQALAKQHVFALAAVDGREVAGGFEAYELEKLEQARREVYIYDLAVDTTWRRRGVATALIRRLQSLAVARGAHAVFVQADYGDDPAIALYEKLGVREEVLHYDLPPRAE